MLGALCTQCRDAPAWRELRVCKPCHDSMVQEIMEAMDEATASGCMYDPVTGTLAGLFKVSIERRAPGAVETFGAWIEESWCGWLVRGSDGRIYGRHATLREASDARRDLLKANGASPAQRAWQRQPYVDQTPFGWVLHAPRTHEFLGRFDTLSDAIAHARAHGPRP